MTDYRYSLQEIETPAVEPLTLAEIKNYLKVDHDNDDNLIKSYISASREICERETGFSLINRKCSMFLDAWPSDILYLPSSPVASVEEIRLYADDGSYKIFPSYNYFSDTVSLYKPRIIIETSFPLPGRDYNGIEVRYTSGFGTSSADIGETLKQGIRQLIAYMYENRGDAAGNALSASGAAALFSTCRRLRVL